VNLKYQCNAKTLMNFCCTIVNVCRIELQFQHNFSCLIKFQLNHNTALAARIYLIHSITSTKMRFQLGKRYILKHKTCNQIGYSKVQD